MELNQEQINLREEIARIKERLVKLRNQKKFFDSGFVGNLSGILFVSGLIYGLVWLTVRPLLGVFWIVLCVVGWKSIGLGSKIGTEIELLEYKLSTLEPKTALVLPRSEVEDRTAKHHEHLETSASTVEEYVKVGEPTASFWERFLDLEHTNNPDANNEQEKGIFHVEPLEVYYRTPRKIDWDIVNKKKQETGLKGEDIVMVIEQEYLTSLGLSDLSERVRHVSKEDGDGTGYDILSYFPDGKEKYIEVKSTTKSTGSSFYLSRNELDFLKNNTENAQVHRVFNVSEEDDDGIPYLQIYTASDILESSQITPTQYKVKIG